MSKPIAVFAALTLALASSAFANTYTSQERHFRIEVPEGWVTSGCETDPYAIIFSPSSDYSKDGGISISCYPLEQVSKEWRARYGIDFSLSAYHAHHVKNLTTWKSEIETNSFLSTSEANIMKLEGGYIIQGVSSRTGMHFLDGYFVSRQYLYKVAGGFPLALYNATVRDAVISVLNSFRALD